MKSYLCVSREDETLLWRAHVCLIACEKLARNEPLKASAVCSAHRVNHLSLAAVLYLSFRLASQTKNDLQADTVRLYLERFDLKSQYSVCFQRSGFSPVCFLWRLPSVSLQERPRDWVKCSPNSTLIIFYLYKSSGLWDVSCLLSCKFSDLISDQTFQI